MLRIFFKDDVGFSIFGDGGTIIHLSQYNDCMARVFSTWFVIGPLILRGQWRSTNDSSLRRMITQERGCQFQTLFYYYTPISCFTEYLYHPSRKKRQFTSVMLINDHATLLDKIFAYGSANECICCSTDACSSIYEITWRLTIANPTKNAHHHYRSCPNGSCLLRLGLHFAAVYSVLLLLKMATIIRTRNVSTVPSGK